MIKNWLKNIFEKNNEEWRTDNSIFKLLISNLDEKGKLKNNLPDLPDEVKADDKLRLAPGLLDALSMQVESTNQENTVLSQLLKKIALKSDKTSEQEFYRIITETKVNFTIIYQFLQSIGELDLPIEPYLFNFAKDLAIRSDNRNAVKFGIALSGLCRNQSIIKDLKILGLHDEFTVYVANSIMNLSDDSEKELWELAQKVDGWGKIHLVDRLAKPGLTKPIKDWLIFEGYKNNIKNEYSAYASALYGELHKKLEDEEIEEKLFRAASEILDALTEFSGPGDDIGTYPFAAQLVQDFLRHANIHTTEISDFIIFHKLKDFLTDIQGDIEQKANGWNEDNISNCIIDIIKLLNDKDWKPTVYEGLESEDNTKYWHAKEAAEKLGLEIWESIWKKLKKNPTEHFIWYDVTHYAKPEYSDQIIAFAIQNLPLKEIGTGPKNSLGMGRKYSIYQSLEHVVTYLKNYPSKGIELILTALQSPVISNRNKAIGTLEIWGKVHWTSEILNELRKLSQIEPNPETKKDLLKILS